MRLFTPVLTPSPLLRSGRETETGGNLMKTNGRSLAIALTFAVLLVGGLVFFKDVRSGPGASRGAGSPPNPSSCLTLKALASSEKAALLGGLAIDFNKSGATLNGHCLRVKVLAMASGAAEQALARGWDEKVDG